MSERHLTSDDALPPCKEGLLRVYSMRYCPFAQRALLVLAHKGIEHELVNVNLMDKPAWLLERHPKGKVPILELGDKMVYESGVCMEYLDDRYPGDKLYSTDPYIKARQQMICKDFSQVAHRVLQIMYGADPQAAVVKVHEALAKLETKMAASRFMTGDNVSGADYYCYPFLERFPAIKLISVADFLQPHLYPKLCAWFDAMLETPGVKATRIRDDEHRHFLLTHRSGKPDYDFTLHHKARL